MKPVTENLCITVVPIYSHKDAERLNYFCLNYSVHYLQGYLDKAPVYFCTIDPIIDSDNELTDNLIKHRAIYALIFHTSDFSINALNDAHLTTTSFISFYDTSDWFQEDMMKIISNKAESFPELKDRIIIIQPNEVTMSYFEQKPYIIKTPKGDVEEKSQKLHGSYYIHIGTYDNHFIISVFDAQKNVIYNEYAVISSPVALLPFDIEKKKFLLLQDQLSILVQAFTYSRQSCTIPVTTFFEKYD